MSPASQNPSPLHTALLSAVSASVQGQSLLNAGAEPVLAHQIAALRSIGIRKFLIEVDTVPGLLLAMADRLIKAGNSVDFIRSPQDLQAGTVGSDLLIVQGEGIYFAPELIAALLDQPRAFIATIDGRAENAAFERMDLNTRWAGLAALSSDTVAKIGQLPDGWSMSSSLLRQAMQENVAQVPLKQSHLQNGDLRRIEEAGAAEKLTSAVMAKRAAREPGFIEARIFAPVATKLAALLSPLNARSAISDGAALLLAIFSAVLGGFGFIVGAAVAGITAMLANTVRLALDNTGLQRRPDFVEVAIWLCLAGALMLAADTSRYQSNEGIFAAAMIGGLALLARQLRLPDWAKKTLQSPALVAILLVSTASIFGIATAAKAVAIAQLMLLVLAKWNHKPLG